MKLHKIIQRAQKKALQSSCRYRVAALGLNRKGEILSCYSNKPRFGHYGGSSHAEMLVMKSSPPSLSTILICRVNSKGQFLSIHSCKVCQQKAKELNIKILTIEDSI